MTIIHMRNIPEKPDWRALDEPLPCMDQTGVMLQIPPNFEWDGSSVPWLFRGIFPRHRHPIASCRHDYRCGKAKTKAERLFADKEFEKDVGKTSWWITKKIGYMGVRIGAWLGFGCHYKRNNK